MMNPDLNDPDWLEGREVLWLDIADSLADTYSKKQISQMKPIFFEEHFDYGNTDKYGDAATHHVNAFFWNPVQTPESWARWFTVDLPEWLDYSVESKLNSWMYSMAFSKGSDNHRYGWPTHTAAELFTFCYGEKVTLGPYRFLNHELERHPLLGSTGVEFYTNWLSDMVGWLMGYNTSSVNVGSQLLPMWLSTLDFINPLYFQHELKESIRDSQEDLQQLFVFCRDDYSLENELLNRTKNVDEALKNNTGLREQFLLDFKRLFIDTEKPEALEQLWHKSQKADFIPAHDMQPILESAPYRSPKMHQIRKWTKARIQELEADL